MADDAPSFGSDDVISGADQTRLRTIIERIERLEEDKKGIMTDIKEIYDEAKGLPEEGIPAGTRWADVPMNWTCPECGARKEDFEMVAV